MKKLLPVFISVLLPPAAVLHQAVDVSAGPLLRMPSVNMEQPIPVPILAKPWRDRTSLADPTLEASVAAALATSAPRRAGPLPFEAINLPDPFQHSRAIRLRHPLDEAPMPPIAPRTPAKGK